MTLTEALAWADKNTKVEAVERLRSRAAVKVLADEVRSQQQTINELNSLCECNTKTMIILMAQNKERAVLRDEVRSLQSKIDELMLEHCQEEMTPEQMAEYERHQVSVPRGVEANVLRDGFGAPTYETSNYAEFITLTTALMHDTLVSEAIDELRRMDE